MIDRRTKRNRALLRGTSALALLVAGLAAAPAAAQQASPGSAQCPIAAGIVTCTGDIHNGFRSIDDPAMTGLVFRDLTTPIAPAAHAPVIDVQAARSLDVTFGTGVVINAVDPFSSLSFQRTNTDHFTNPPDQLVTRNYRVEGAVVLKFDPSHNDSLTLHSAADIDVRFNFGAADFHAFTGGLMIQGASNVDLVNSGHISVASRDAMGSLVDVPSAEPMAIYIDHADRVSVLNSGTLSVAGSVGDAILVGARDIAITNSGTISFSGTAFEMYAVNARAVANTAAAASIVFTNTGTIVNNASLFYPDFQDLPRVAANLFQVGRGTTSFTNSGSITATQVRISATAQGDNDDVAVIVDNRGALTSSSIIVEVGALGIPRSVLQFADEITEFGVLPDRASIDLTNSAALSLSSLAIRVSARDARASLVNSGDLLNGGLSASSQTTATGNALTIVENDGDIRILDTDLVAEAISASGDRFVRLTNSGAIHVESANETGGIGIAVAQGTGTDPFFFHLCDTVPALCPPDPGRQFFQDSVDIANSGTIDIIGQEDNVRALSVIAFADIHLDNDGAITLQGSRLQEGQVEFGDGFDLAGVVLDTYSDVVFNSRAPISLTVSDDGPAGAAILLVERSHRPSAVDRDLANGFLHPSYDRDADINSRFAVNLTANVTANGRDQFGIFAYLGLSDTAAGTRSDNFFFDDFVFENDKATLAISVPTGISVTGGSGIGSAIAAEGAGIVTLNNAGSIIGRGGAQSAAIHLSSSAQLDPVYQRRGDFPDNAVIPLVFLPDRFITLRDSLNTGTIRSDGGYGIWTELGAIVNLTNRGLILGGAASVQALKTSSILNDVGGTLDGRIMLEGAASTLTNNGIIQVSTPGFVTHQINGNFTQSASGTLSLRAGAGARDLMTVTGNFLLNGDLNLALGAPTLNPIITVGGNLTLDGRLNVTDAGGFGEGVYRLFNYGGTLTDNGLELGALPGGARGNIQTLFAGQVNLIIGGVQVQFWDGGDSAPDGTIDGGSGTWNNSNTNWTRSDGNINDPWGGGFAVFQATPGTVTIDSAGVSAGGLQFAVDGYRIEGGGLTLVAPATLRVGDGSAAGANMSATIASAIAGNGGIDKTDLGTLTLTGANSYAGGTRVSGGVLQIGADSALGASGGGVTLDGGTLRLSAGFSTARGFTIGAGGGTIDGGANAISLTGALGGSGALTKTGSATLTFGGNGTAYGGTFTLAGGAIRLDGTLGGTLQVDAGTRLSGAGTLNTLVLAGTLAPGNSIGTLNATGNITFRAGSIFELEVAAAGGADRLAAAGTATIEGGTVRVTTLDPETQYVDGTRYTFLTAAGGRTGQFTSLAESSAFLDFALGYDATSAFVTVSVIRTFPDVALTFNQRQASTALAALGQTAGSDSLAVYNSILMLDADPARAAFDASSGEIYPVLLATALRRGAGLTDRMLARANAGFGEGWGLWGGAEGHDGRVDGDGNGARYSRHGIGGMLGIDYRGGGNRWAAGVGGGYTHDSATLRARSSTAAGDGWNLGGYARFGNSGTGFTLSASAGYLHGDADVARTIAFGTISRQATSTVSVNAIAVAAEARYGVAIGAGWSVGPSARIGHASADLGRFAEAGAASLDLSGGSDNDEGRTQLGGGLFARWESGRGSFDLAAGYAHGGNPVTEIGLVMAGAPNQPYRVRAARADSSAVTVAASGRYALGGNWSIGVHLDGRFGGEERSIAGSAELGWRF